MERTRRRNHHAIELPLQQLLKTAHAFRAGGRGERFCEQILRRTGNRRRLRKAALHDRTHALEADPAHAEKAELRLADQSIPPSQISNGVSFECCSRLWSAAGS